MTAPLNPAELARLRAVTERATPGEWTYSNPDDDMCMNAYVVEAENLPDGKIETSPMYGEFNAYKTVAITLLQSPRLACVSDNRWDANAAYIAALNPATVTRLLDHVAALEAENERLRAEIDALIPNPPKMPKPVIYRRENDDSAFAGRVWFNK